MSRIAIIERCGQCCHAHYSQSEGWECRKAGRLFDDEEPYWQPSSPPDWCPLTPAADVARVKPLAWVRRNPAWLFADSALGTYEVRQVPTGWLSEGPDWGSAWHSSETLAVSDCEAHYRAALFGRQGPLVQIEVKP